MPLDPDSCYAALRARDRRFDGIFFVGVATTGIYCRPICPARLPSADRCAFFGSAAEAERAGFRACFRCRPELAPGHAAIDANARLARAAASRIEAGFLNDHSLEGLAASLDVTARHLRRIMESELGIAPVELAQTRRLALAKQLLHDTALPLADVAFAAGFRSIRRFNALFQSRFGQPPSALRRAHGHAVALDFIPLRLDYRPPLAWQQLLHFLEVRAIPGVEQVRNGEYQRSVVLDDCVGWVAVNAEAGRPSVRARVSLSLAPKLMELTSRLRCLFDLDARPDLIATHLQDDPTLAPLVKAQPGLRVPGAFDGFELAIRAILGQQVSVRAATTLCGRLVEQFGRQIGCELPGLGHQFPRAPDLAAAAPALVQAIGIPATRAHTIVAFARAVSEARIDLSVGADPELALGQLQSIPGIGPWTAQYLAMRALRWPNAFPSGDLAVRKALGVKTSAAAEQRAHGWQPWRSYAVIHLWNSLAQGG